MRSSSNANLFRRLERAEADMLRAVTSLPDEPAPARAPAADRLAPRLLFTLSDAARAAMEA